MSCLFLNIRSSGPYIEVGYECDGSEDRLQDCSPFPLFSRSSEYYLYIECEFPLRLMILYINSVVIHIIYTRYYLYTHHQVICNVMMSL